MPVTAGESELAPVLREQLAAWERARRQVRLSAPGETGYTVRTGAVGLPQATLLWSSPRARSITVNGAARPAQTVERWGVAFRAVILDLLPESTYTVEAE